VVSRVFASVTERANDADAIGRNAHSNEKVVTESSVVGADFRPFYVLVHPQHDLLRVLQPAGLLERDAPGALMVRCRGDSDGDERISVTFPFRPVDGVSALNSKENLREAIKKGIGAWRFSEAMRLDVLVSKLLPTQTLVIADPFIPELVEHVKTVWRAVSVTTHEPVAVEVDHE
jgi:hypothetical protein